MLESVVTDLASPSFRAKAIAAVAGDLNIARRTWSAYPPGHPQTVAALQKLGASFRQLCRDAGQTTLGITREGLLLDDTYVDKENRVLQGVAAMLFERGIGTLLILQPPSDSELTALLRLLALKREEILAGGGIEPLWQESGITSLQVRGIRYDRFIGSEELLLDEQRQERESLWEQLTRVLATGGDLGLVDEDGELSPELLAARLNACFGRRLGVGGGLSSNTLLAVTRLMTQVFKPGASGGTATAEDADSAENASVSRIKADVRTFISALDPVLRRQILDGFCETGHVDEETATELFRYLEPSLLRETYASAEQYAAAPLLLQQILRKLLPHMARELGFKDPQDEVRTKMHTLLQEHQQEAFMPDGYVQGLLDALQKGAVKQLASDEIQGLLQTLTPAFVDSRSSELILQMVVADPTGASARELIANLADMCGHFLELGDYGQVLKILNQAADPRLPQPLRLAMRDAFCRREFLDEILSGLTIWGKPKYDQVALLIQVLGRAFIEPLLDRMAEEDNMSLRRFMMDRVQSFGEAARPHLLSRLSDGRWYVLRNVLLMLRPVARQEDSELLRPLLRHSNQRVRAETVKLLLHLGDPAAHRQLLRDLESADREVQLNAISMADRSSPPEMSRKLLALVTGGGFSAVECETKSAAIHALAEIGKPQVLPELLKVLGSRSLLSYKALLRIKLDIVRSLDRYPVSAVEPVLQRLADGGDEIARQARESLKNLRSRPS